MLYWAKISGERLQDHWSSGYSNRIRTLVAMATYSSHRLIMGKEEIDNFSVSIGILESFLQKCLLNSLLRFVQLLSKSVNLIGCRGGKKGQFS